MALTHFLIPPVKLHCSSYINVLLQIIAISYMYHEYPYHVLYNIKWYIFIVATPFTIDLYRAIM